MRPRTWFHASHRSSSRKVPSRAGHATNRGPTRRKLLLEGLEDRCLLAFDVLAEYATAFNTQAMELARIDADDRPDLVLIENGRVTIRPGNPGGSFGNPLALTDEIIAQGAITGDFDNDGATDLVTATDGQLALRLGNGDGSFQQPQPFTLPAQLEPAITGAWFYGQSISSLATGDLNADGKLDLVVGGSTSFPTGIACGYYSCGYTFSYNGYVNVLLGTGTGSFSYQDTDPNDENVNAHLLGAYRLPTAMAVADLNHDGQADVLTDNGYGGLSALLGNGTGSLQNAIHSGSGSGFSSVSLGDLDGDGDLDTISRTGNNLIVQNGQGDGSFVQDAVMNVGHKLDSAVMGDVNGDGKLDLVSVGSATCTTYGYYGGCYDATHTRQASVLLGDGQGGFSLPISSSLGIVDETYSNLIDLALADLTGDGRVDLVTIDNGFQRAAIVAVNDGEWIDPEEISIADVSVVEEDSGNVNAVFTVTLTGDPGGQVTVEFVVFDYYDFGALGAAQAGVDYTAQSGTLTFAPGILSQTITVPVFGDRIGEGNETFLVNLSNPTGALLRDAEAVGTIADNEPTISINHAYGTDPLTVVEGDSGTTLAVFTVTLSKPYDQEVTVDYFTSTGHTADIISTSGTLRFAPGQTSKDINVQVVGDLIDEYLEAFNVYLTNPSLNTYILNSGGYCYIEDNDPTPTVSIGDVSKSEGNSGTAKFNFTLTLSAPGNGVGVGFATANGTATTANQDYTAKSGYVYFDVGQTIATISIDVKGDTASEANETFFVNLVSASGATIADSQGTGTILNDDSGSSPPAISINDASIVEGNSGTKLLTFTITLSQASSKSVSVKYKTANGTATTGNNDYVSTSGTITFSPGQTTKTITVKIKGDTKIENDEYFYVNLYGASNATIADSQGKGIILTDDFSTSKRSKR